jgi:hypothetical protein
MNKKIILTAVLALCVTSCIEVTLNTQPPEDWMLVWEKCFHNPFCDVNEIRPWYGRPPTNGTGTRVGNLSSNM